MPNPQRLQEMHLKVCPIPYEEACKKVQNGRRIFCCDARAVHYEQEAITTFQFVDYSWPCSACGGRHCSMCFYSSDGETIFVTDCGRFK